MSYTLIAAETRKARKPHKCIWCGQKIEIGERYTHERCVFEGDAQSNDWHLECEEDMRVAMDGETDFQFDSWAQDRPEKRLGFTIDAEGGT